MVKRFFYVYTQRERDLLLNMGYPILTSDYERNIYLFENVEKFTFSELRDKDIRVIETNTLTF